MPKLKEVLAGILRDLTESRVVADLTSVEYFDLYQKDPVLAHLPIPRMTVKDLSLRLRFAVEDHAPRHPDEDAQALLDRLWRSELRRRILPQVLGAVLRRPGPAEQASALAEAIAASLARTRFQLTDTSEQGLARAAEITASGIVAGLEELPADVKRDLPPQQELRSQVDRSVREGLAAMVPRFRQLLAAHQTAQLELDVMVKQADLAGVQESSIQEVTITISLDDLQVAAVPPAPPGERT